MEGFDIQAKDTLGRHQSKLDTFCKSLMNPTGALDAALAKLGPLRTNVDASRGVRATLESLRAQTAFIASLSPPVSDPRASLPLERRTGPLLSKQGGEIDTPLPPRRPKIFTREPNAPGGGKGAQDKTRQDTTWPNRIQPDAPSQLPGRPHMTMGHINKALGKQTFCKHRTTPQMNLC